MFSLPGWPGGDPGTISDAADAWKELSKALDPVFSTCNTAITGLEATWTGEAQRKFNTVWSAFHKLYGGSVGGTKDTGDALDKVSEKLSDAHKEYEHTIEITTAAIAVALALSWCTFGVSDVAAGEAAASGVAVIDTICTVLGEAIADLAGEWIAPELLANIIVGGSIAFVTNVGEQSADSTWNEGHWSVSWWDAAEAGAFGAVGGGIGGKFGEIDNLAAKVAFNTGLGFATGAAQQGINYAEGQGFDWNKVIASTVEEGLTGGLEHNHAGGDDDDTPAPGGTDDSGSADNTGGTHDGGSTDNTGSGGGKHEAPGGTHEGDTPPDPGTSTGGGKHEAPGGTHEGDTPPDPGTSTGGGKHEAPGGTHEGDTPLDPGTSTGGGKHEAPTGGGKHEANVPVDSPSLVGAGGRHRAE